MDSNTTWNDFKIQLVLWKKPNPQSFILCDLMYIVCWKKQHHRDRNQFSVVKGGKKGRVGFKVSTYKPFRMMKLFFIVLSWLMHEFINVAILLNCRWQYVKCNIYKIKSQNVWRSQDGMLSTLNKFNCIKNLLQVYSYLFQLLTSQNYVFIYCTSQK